MGLFLNRETLLQLYAEADENDNNNIEFEEFQLAINLLKKQVGNNALAMMGLTKEELVQVLIIAAIFLLLLFVFIFMGVTAFSTADGFSAVINSILPAAAGLSMSGGGGSGGGADNSKLFRTLSKCCVRCRTNCGEDCKGDEDCLIRVLCLILLIIVKLNSRQPAMLEFSENLFLVSIVLVMMFAIAIAVALRFICNYVQR